jgi:hypothetical protein
MMMSVSAHSPADDEDSDASSVGGSYGGDRSEGSLFVVDARQALPTTT